MPDGTFSGSLGPGVKLGKYEVREKLAVGGMAIIYKAYDPSLDRYVAIKQIAPHLAQDERFLERFRTEAQTLARLSSSQANIVTVHELIQQDGQLYLVMECVEGTTLRALMDRGPVPLQTGLGVLLSTALGLKAMHTQNIVHRDLTPANIMMAKDGALKITDFGLIGHSGGKTSLPKGTTKYMAPEMFTGMPVDARADLYSLGMIAYEMFVGPDKFAEAFKDVLRDEKAQQVRWMHWHSNPALKAPALRDLQPGIPPLVSKIVDRMMEKDPSKRFASSEQIIKWLRRIFVMHVQGKSVSQTDSEQIEKELEADTGAPGAVAVRGDRTPAPGRSGAAATIETGEKTAALPQPKWTWQRAAFWAAVVLLPLILASGGLLYWSHVKMQEREHLAEGMQLDGDEAYKQGDYTAADTIFTKMALEFRDLPSYALYAKQQATMARAENALKTKDWDKADRDAGQAEKLGVRADWVNDFRGRFNKFQHIEQVMKQAKIAQEQGQFTAAVDMLTDLQKRYPDVDVSEDIARLREELELAEYRRRLNDGKQAFETGSLDNALVAFNDAIAKRDTPEAQEWKAKVIEEKKVRALAAAIQAAETAGKWADAAAYYAQLMQIRPSEATRSRMNNAKAEELAAIAREMVKNNLSDPATAQYAEVLKYNPQHAEAMDWMKKVGHQKQLATTLAAAKDAMAKREWEQAINSYKQALGMLTDAQAAEKTRIQGEIEEATYQALLDQARQALAQNNFDEAEEKARAAQAVKDSDTVKALLAQNDTRREYTRHLTVGKELLSQLDYVRALQAFQQAQKITDTQEIRDLVTLTQYQRYLAQGKSQFADKQFQRALSIFGIAQKYKDTEEVRGWISLCMTQLQGGGGAAK
jgi:tetratricopeptide (TPR) repeat protein